jgi:hypothetical protein
MTLGERAMAHVTLHYDAPTKASRLLDLLKAEAMRRAQKGLLLQWSAALSRRCPAKEAMLRCPLPDLGLPPLFDLLFCTSTQGSAG